jgi:4-diphosphocytidyl-2-C-methyl-D-erythritol kinase
MTRRAAPRVRVRAPAKVNLTLRVLGIRADGYHELRTTFQSLALHDTLTFERTDGPFTIATDDPLCPTDRSNLVWAAAARLWDLARRRGEPAGVHVHIRKRIPSQAGLGGGSSDAASTLNALQRVWGIEVEPSALESIARSLGADVAFFLRGGTALGVDRGDLLFPLEGVPRLWVVVARPSFGVSTREAYRWWDEQHRAEQSGRVSRPTAGGPRTEGPPPGRGRRGRRRAPARREALLALPPSEWVNDLQAPVAARHPAIDRIVRKLQGAGALYAAMSGSGSAVFGLFERRTAAAGAAERIVARGVDVWLTRTTTASEHLRWSVPRLD